MADRQDVNAEGVNAYYRVPLYAHHAVGVSWSVGQSVALGVAW